MTATELKLAQEAIDDLVTTTAHDCGLSSDDDGIYPVYDGVADEESYLDSGLKVAWILKEPYDDFAEEKPCGGGWSLVKDCFLKHDENWVDDNGRKQWKNPVWQKVVYVMYGFRHGLCWDEMDWIRDNPSMMDEIKSIAWINLSKMPARTNSSNGYFANLYDTVWKEVVDRQIAVCRPDVLLFGRTFAPFLRVHEEISREKIKAISNEWAEVWRCNGQYWVDTYHPGRKGRDYVNALIDVLNGIQSDIGHSSAL